MGGPYQNVRYIFWDPPLKCKIGRWTSPRCRFCGEGLQNTFKMQVYIFQAPFKNTLRHVAYILGTSTLLNGGDYLSKSIIYRLYMQCIVLVFLLISLNKSSWPTTPCQHRGWKACCRSVASAAPRKCWRRRFVGTCGWLKPWKKRWYHGNFMGISWEYSRNHAWEVVSSTEEGTSPTKFKISPTTNWHLYDLSVIENDRTSRNVTGSRLFVQGNYPQNGQTFQVGELSWLIHIQTILGELW